jgi:hypothetical protein
MSALRPCAEIVFANGELRHLFRVLNDPERKDGLPCLAEVAGDPHYAVDREIGYGRSELERQLLPVAGRYFQFG